MGSIKYFTLGLAIAAAMMFVPAKSEAKTIDHDKDLALAVRVYGGFGHGGGFYYGNRGYYPRGYGYGYYGSPRGYYWHGNRGYGWGRRGYGWGHRGVRGWRY